MFTSILHVVILLCLVSVALLVKYILPFNFLFFIQTEIRTKIFLQRFFSYFYFPQRYWIEKKKWKQNDEKIQTNTIINWIHFHRNIYNHTGDSHTSSDTYFNKIFVVRFHQMQFAFFTLSGERVSGFHIIFLYTKPYIAFWVLYFMTMRIWFNK